MYTNNYYQDFKIYSSPFAIDLFEAYIAKSTKFATCIFLPFLPGAILLNVTHSFIVIDTIPHRHIGTILTAIP